MGIQNKILGVFQELVSDSEVYIPFRKGNCEEKKINSLQLCPSKEVH